jgi:excisionase family DNA binding protein
MQLCEVIGTGRAAEIVGVSRDTIRRWAKSGRLRHILLPSGQMRFYEADIEALLRPVEIDDVREGAGVPFVDAPLPGFEVEAVPA